MHSFGVVQAIEDALVGLGVVQVLRISSNLLEPHHYRHNKVCRVLSHEFGVVRLYRTFSTTIFPGETSVQGAYALV